MSDARSKPLVPRLVMIAGAVLMVACFFLPYLEGSPEFREQAVAAGDTLLMSGTGITSASVANLSLFELANMLTTMTSMFGTEDAAAINAVVNVVFYSVLAVSIITLVLAAFGKPVGTIVMSLGTVALTLLVRLGVLGDAVANTDIYTWGLASWLIYVGIAIVVAGSAWMLAAQRVRRSL